MTHRFKYVKHDDGIEALQTFDKPLGQTSILDPEPNVDWRRPQYYYNDNLKLTPFPKRFNTEDEAKGLVKQLLNNKILANKRSEEYLENFIKTQ